MDNQRIKLHLPMKIDRFNSINPGVCFVSVAVFCFCYLVNQAASATQTNVLFETIIREGEASENHVQEFMLIKNAEGKYRFETVPAEDDPGGHWGVPTNGVQMSTRFYQTNFAVKEPISLVILLRNAGHESIECGSASWVNYPYFLTVWRHGQKLEPLLPTIKPGTKDGSGWTISLKPGTQRRDVLRLDKIYDLNQPGGYEVAAERGVYMLETKRSARVHSGTAKFKVVPKTEAQTNAPPTDANR